MDNDLHERWTRDGYVTVPGLFDAATVEKLRPVCEAVLRRWRERNPETGEPGGGPDATVMRHLNHSGYFPEDRGGLRLLMDAASSESVLEVGRTILGEEPLFRCTSLFMNPQVTSSGTSRVGRATRRTS